MVTSLAAFLHVPNRISGSDLDLFRVVRAWSGFGRPHRQHAILEIGRDVFGGRIRGNADRPSEDVIFALEEIKGSALLLVPLAFLAPDGRLAFFDRDIDIARRHRGQFSVDLAKSSPLPAAAKGGANHSAISAPRIRNGSYNCGHYPVRSLSCAVTILRCEVPQP